MFTVGHALAAVDQIIAGARACDLEGQHLEFKADVTRSIQDTLRTLTEAVACMANGQGGVVVAGVSDRQWGVEAILGTRLEVDATRHRVFDLTDPGLVVGVEQHERLGKKLLLLHVPVSPTVHAVGGRCSERVGDVCTPMSPDRVATVVVDRRADDWSIQDSNVPVSRATAAAIESARTLLARLPDPVRRSYAEQSDLDLMRRLGVVTERSTLTNAGQLLLSDAMNQQLIAYTFRRTPTGALAVNEHYAGPLLLSLQRVMDLVDARLERTSVNLAGGQQLQVADLPEAAVREALVNAVMHRDYRRHGHVVAQHTPTRFSVQSPGPFLTGITPDNVLTVSSRSRNPHLAGVIRTLGLAETAGTGVDRMFAAMARIGHQPPAYVSGLDYVEVSLAGGAPNAYVARYAASLPPEEAEDADTMLVLLSLLSYRTVNAGRMAPWLQRSDREAQSVLERLSVDPIAMIEATRQSAQHVRPNYRLRADVLAVLGPAATYHRRTTDDYDRKLVALVNETGSVNARMVRLLLDVDSSGASRVLADLVARRILIRTSAAPRGRSVTYGPGPEFPGRRSVVHRFQHGPR